jgi:hypothetical protein
MKRFIKEFSNNSVLKLFSIRDFTIDLFDKSDGLKPHSIFVLGIRSQFGKE